MIRFIPPRRAGTPGRQRRSTGQSLTEFAIILPVLLMLTIGVVDVTRVFGDWIALSNGVREAALWASQPPNFSDTSTVSNIVRLEGPLDPARLTVSAPSCGGGCSASSTTVTVSARYEVDLIVPILSDLLGSPVNLDASATAPIVDHSVAPPP